MLKRRNDREAIRRKLAMGDEEPEEESAQNDNKLRVCYVNQTSTAQETASPPAKSVSGLSQHRLMRLQELKYRPSSSEDGQSFAAHQARLQAEAKLALAQAKDMARMQMELERQHRRKRNHIADMLGITFPDSRRKFSRPLLSDLNRTQLQLIVNDLHAQIKEFNDELVKHLMERDDLHMEQDAMLVDIEDFNRYLSEQYDKPQRRSSATGVV